jgi:hypothetical protein
MAQMNRDKAQGIIDQIKAALEPICELHGLRLAKDTARFDSAGLRMTLELNCLDAGGADASEKMTWELCASRYGVRKEDYGKVIRYSDMKKYKLVAVAPKSPRYPFVGEDLFTHRRYKLTAEGVRWGLEQLQQEAAR